MSGLTVGFTHALKKSWEKIKKGKTQAMGG